MFGHRRGCCEGQESASRFCGKGPLWTLAAGIELLPDTWLKRKGDVAVGSTFWGCLHHEAGRAPPAGEALRLASVWWGAVVAAKLFGECWLHEVYAGVGKCMLESLSTLQESGNIFGSWEVCDRIGKDMVESVSTLWSWEVYVGVVKCTVESGVNVK